MGALQISAYSKIGGEITEEELRESAEGFVGKHGGGTTGLESVSFNDFSGFHQSYTTPEEHWRQWFLRAWSTGLFITYNCDAQDRGVEDGAIEQILSSLKGRE